MYTKKEEIDELFWGLAERITMQETLVDTLIKRVEAIEDRLLRFIRNGNGKKKGKID